MIIIKLVLCFIILVIIPEILGMLLTRFMAKNNDILFSLLIGYIIQFALLELLAIPMIMLEVKYTTLLYSWSTIVLILTLISLIINAKKFNFGKMFTKLKKIKDKSNIICIIAVFFILIQIIISILYTHTDADDSFYVGTATTTIAENSMYSISAYTGEAYQKLLARYALAPFSLYNAIISSILHIHPTIVAHSIFAPMFICLAYVLYASIALKLFQGNKTDVSIFLILLSVINVFGNFCVYTTFSFLLFRIWQGKAMLCNIMLPSIWLMVWNYIEDKNLVNWFLIFITMIATCFVTEMGIALGAITLISLAIIFAIKDKKIKDLLFLSICEIPCVVTFGLYLIIK